MASSPAPSSGPIEITRSLGSRVKRGLGRYTHRIAIGNERLVALEDGRVTFKYNDSATDEVKFATVSAEEFIRRFLQHVLPERFVKVRYYVTESWESSPAQ